MPINNLNADGRVGRDIEIRYLNTQKGQVAVGTFPLPVTYGFGDNKITTWAKVEVWGKLAESLQNSLKKGVYVSVNGPCKVETWHGRDGQERKDLCIKAESISVINPMPKPQQQAANQPMDQQPQVDQDFQQAAQAQQQMNQQFHDDIPF